jgi:hypothetical protein
LKGCLRVFEQKVVVVRMLMHLLCAALFVSTMCLVGTSPAFAQNYTQLQVLLPGEAAAPGTGTGKLGAPSAQTVGVPFTILVRACDPSWNTVRSISHTVSMSSTDPTATLSGTVRLADGEAVMTVTLNSEGHFTFTARDSDNPSINPGVSAVVSTLTLYGFDFDRVPDWESDVDAGDDFTIELEAIDQRGRRVSGFSGNVSLKQTTSEGDGRISPETVRLTNGRWEGRVTVYRATDFSRLYAWIPSSPLIDGRSRAFDVDPGSFRRLQIVVPGQQRLPGSISGLVGTPASQGVGQTFLASIYSTDEWWNRVSRSDRVRIVSGDPRANTPIEGSLSSGFRQFVVVFRTGGMQTLTVTDLSRSDILGMTSAGILVTPSSAGHFVIAPFPTPVTAGNPVTITIRAHEGDGSPVADFSGSALLFATTGPGSMSPERITFTNGVWQGQVRFFGAGPDVEFTCSDFAAPPHTGSSAAFQVLPGPYAGVQVLLPGQVNRGGTETGFEGFPDEQRAGSRFDVRVRAVDVYWNRVPSVNAVIDLSATDPFADMPSEITLSNGERVVNVTLFKAGTQTISAVDSSTASIADYTSEPVEVLAGAYSRLLALAPGETIAPGSETGRTGFATDQSINFAFTVSVYATDPWFNPVPGVTDVVGVTTTDALAQLPPDTPLEDGYASLSVRLSTGGYQLITISNVTQPAMARSSTQVKAISSGFHLETDMTPLNVQAGEQFTLTVRVTNDAGSVIQEIFSFITVEVRHAQTGQPGRGLLATSQFQLLQGQRTIPETYTVSEPIVLVVRDDAGNAPAITQVLTVVPGPPQAIELSSNPPWTGGNQHALLRATVVDGFGNGVADQPVAFTVVSGPGTLTPMDSNTNAEGIAEADFLGPRSNAMTRIQATSNSLASELDVQTALVDPTTATGSITNYPNPFHPEEAPTTIAYKLGDNANVTVQIYTLQGNLVWREQFAMGGTGGAAGLNQITWDGRNGDGDLVASGGYVIVVESDGNGESQVMRRKIAVVR